MVRANRELKVFTKKTSRLMCGILVTNLYLHKKQREQYLAEL